MILKYGDYKLRNLKNVNESEEKEEGYLRLEDEILIATNEAYWGWNDSSSRNTAGLYLNVKTGVLRLCLTNRSWGSGLGAGRDKTTTLYDGNVGNVNKPNLKLIISILAKKENRMTVTRASGYNYSREWYDVQNNVKDTLSNILSNNRGVKTTKLIRNTEEEPKMTPKYHGSNIRFDVKTNKVTSTGGNKKEKLATLRSKLYKLSDSDIDALLQKLSEGKTNENSLKNRLGGWIDGYVSINIDGNGDILGIVIDEIQKSINNIDGEGDIHLYINKNKVTESVENDDIESSLKKGDKFEYVFLYDKGKKEEKITVVVDNPEKYIDEKDCEAEAIKRFKEKHGKDTEYDIIDK